MYFRFMSFNEYITIPISSILYFLVTIHFITLHNAHHTYIRIRLSFKYSVIEQNLTFSLK